MKIEFLNIKHRSLAIGLLLMMIMSATTVSAQQLTGRVLDMQNNPVVGAVVAVKGGEGVTTDDNGLFTLTCSADDVLTINHIGFLYKETKVGETPNYFCYWLHGYRCNHIASGNKIFNGSECMILNYRNLHKHIVYKSHPAVTWLHL